MPDALGLDPAMHEVYRSLLQRGGATPEELIRELHLSGPQVQEILERLCALGLTATAAAIPPEVSPRLIPRDPQESLGPTLQHLEAEIAERKAQVQQAREAVAGLTAAFSDRRGHVAVSAAEVCHGVEAIRLRVERLLENATSRVLCFVPASAHEIMLNVGVPNLQRLTERGVSVRLLFMGSLRNDLIARDHAELVQSIVGTVRTSPALPLPMLVLDSDVAVVPADDDPGREGGDPVAQVVHNRALSIGLAALFERIWASSEELTHNPAPDPSTGLTAAERGLLELLGRGMTDAAAARKLGVSLRTVRRMMSEIMSRLGAHSRFEAGVRAAARGWLGPPAAPAPSSTAGTADRTRDGVPAGDDAGAATPGPAAKPAARAHRGDGPSGTRTRVAAALNR